MTDGTGHEAGSGDVILVVDDEPVIRSLFARALRDAGYTAVEAADGREALELLDEQRVSLVVLDSTMPRLDGPGTIVALRRREATRTLPVILVTGRASPEERVSGLELGADDYLTKPVVLDELVARVRAQLRMQAAWRDASERELDARRAVIGALRRVRLDGSAERTARAIAAELPGALGVASVALMAFGGGGRVDILASVGELAARYRAGVPLRGPAARLLRERAMAGPWVARERRIRGSRARTDGQAALDLAVVPLDAGDGPIGVLIAGQMSAPGGQPIDHVTRLLSLLEECAGLVTTMLRSGLEAGATLAEARAVSQAVIAKRAFVPHFQPIVRLADGVTVGHEALTRFTDGVQPDIHFAEAERLGLGHALERATLESAMLAATTLARGSWLSLNVSPSLLVGDLLPEVFFAAADREIVLELTEHAPVADYGVLRARIGAYEPSVRVAVDDAGSGYASLRHILALRPAFVKLDIAWVHGIAGDPARQALIAGLVHFAAELGCELIGEGLETEPERRTLLSLGVRFGQGYLFGRPAPARG